MMSEKFRFSYYAIFAIVIGWILIGYWNALKMHGVENIFETSFGEISVAVGTILLAFFTMELAYGEVKDNREMRQLMIEEAYNERRRLRIKEQLEGLYSFLIAHRDLFVEGDYEHTKGVDIDPFMAKYLIKGKYEFLASQKLKLLFREYFKLSPSDIQMDRDNWIRLMNEIRNCIDVDFHYLIQEYNDLTKHLIPKK